jgi:transcriptional regulator with XRE-family HTH domain
MTGSVHIGKRIKFFRERRGLTQKQLGEAAGLLEATVRKYEIEQRNPKPDQIKKIADALGITAYALSGFDIETDADVIAMILAIEEKVGIKFDGKKDGKGKIDPKTLTLHIDSLFVNDALARWGNALNHLEKMKKSRDAVKKKTERKQWDEEIAKIEEEFEQAKYNLMDSNRLVGKDRDGIAVKMSPDLSRFIKPPK